MASRPISAAPIRLPFASTTSPLAMSEPVARTSSPGPFAGCTCTTYVNTPLSPRGSAIETLKLTQPAPTRPNVYWGFKAHAELCMHAKFMCKILKKMLAEGNANTLTIRTRCCPSDPDGSFSVFSICTTASAPSGRGAPACDDKHSSCVLGTSPAPRGTKGRLVRDTTDVT